MSLSQGSAFRAQSRGRSVVDWRRRDNSDWHAERWTGRSFSVTCRRGGSFGRPSTPTLLWNFLEDGRGEMEVCCSPSAKLTDEAASEGFALLTRAVLERQVIQPVKYIWQLDLGEQFIGDVAIRSLVSAVVACSIIILDLRLHRNQIGPCGVQALGHLCHSAPAPPWELHLSHNYIPAWAIKELFLVVATSRNVPCKDPRVQAGAGNKWPPRPVWLRLEYQRVKWQNFEHRNRINNVKVAEDMLESVSELMVKQRERSDLHIPRFEDRSAAMVCLAKKEEGCNPRRCCRSHWSAAKQGWVGCPLLHLPFFYNQSDTDFHRPLGSRLHERDTEWEVWKPDVQAAKQGVPDAIQGPDASHGRTPAAGAAQDDALVVSGPVRQVPMLHPTAPSRNNVPRDPSTDAYAEPSEICYV